MKRKWLGVAALGGALLAGCSSLPVLVATKELDSTGKEAVSALGSALDAHVEVSRQRAMLGWTASPAEAAGGDASVDLLRGLACDPAGDAQRFAVGSIRKFGGTLAELAKVPAEGLAPAVKAINAHARAAREMRDKGDANLESDREVRVAACRSKLGELYTSPFVTTMVPSMPTEKPRAWAGMAVTPALDALGSLYEALAAIVGLIEEKARVDLIRQYVEKSENRVNAALEVLGSGKGDAGAFAIQATVDDRMRYFLARGSVDLALAMSPSFEEDEAAFTARMKGKTEAERLAEVKARKFRLNLERQVRVDAASRAARSLQEFEDLVAVDAGEDLLKPVVELHGKFIAIARDPHPTIDDFMTAMTTLRGNRDKWIKARDDWRAIRKPASGE